MDAKTAQQRRLLKALPLTGLVLAGVLWCAAALTPPPPDRLAAVKERGTLVMLTRNSASSYFIEGEAPTGPEYLMARDFAQQLGVQLEVRVADQFGDLEALLGSGEGDLIAANLTRTPQRERQFRFGPDYASTHTLVVYRRDLPRPHKLEDLAGLAGTVLAGSSYEEQLQQLAEKHGQLSWTARSDVGVEELLHAVAEGQFEYTLVDERIYRLHQRYYPEVRAAFTVGDAQPLAWAFARDDDDSLAHAARVYMSTELESGRLQALQAPFFEAADHLEPVDMIHFQRRMRDRLPHYLPFFQEAASQHALDWRLLAAMGYQESHWDPAAVSRTGVRGMMMLTRNTAASLGIEDRRDPLQSIRGGAAYFIQQRNRLPERIAEPDRTWMALAAYNIGMGHLEDARRLTQQRGGNPDRWVDVRDTLPLLAQERWHRQTRYGYARGYEARDYVDNIQRFFDTLVWMETRSHPLLANQVIAAP